MSETTAALDQPVSHDYLEREYSLFGVGEPHPVATESGAASCSCSRCERWEAYVRSGGAHRQPLYLVPTAGLVDGLARWLRDEQAAGGESPLRVLELGAGDGSLTHYLRRALADAPIELVASDSFARGLLARGRALLASLPRLHRSPPPG